MPRIFLRSALRNLLRHKTQMLINVGSLAIGLTVFGFAFLYVKQELSYDRGWQDSGRVHRLLVEQRGLPGLTDGVYNLLSAAIWPRLTDYFSPYIERAARVSSGGVRLKDEDNFYLSVKFVEPAFLDIFRVESIEGDLARTLSGPGFIAMDEDLAARLNLVGHVGERITFTSTYGGELEFELAAIYRSPRPVTSATQVGLLTLMHDYARPLFVAGERTFVPWETSTSVWLKLRPGVTTENFNAQQPAFVQQEVPVFNEALGPERKVSDHLFYRWQPLADIHFNPIPSEAAAGRGDWSRVLIFAAVGLLVLLVACSNSVSLGLAAALERRREIGVRKAAGALPGDIAQQQLGESMLLALLALLPAVAILELLLPPFQALMPWVRVDAGWPDYALLALIAAVVGVACGAYPALVLASTRPQAVLRAGAQAQGKRSFGLRSVLVATQFGLASVLLIGTGALYLQLTFTRAQPLGFDASNVAMIFQSRRDVSMTAFRNELSRIPGVVELIRGSSPPAANMPLTFNMMTLVRNSTDGNEVEAQMVYSDFDFIPFMRIPLLAGRNFDERFDGTSLDSQQFADGGERATLRILLNAAAARQLGFFPPEDAVEQTIYHRVLNMQTGAVLNRQARIIGVVEDNMYGSLKRRPIPEMYMSMPTDAQETGTGNVMLRYEDAAEDAIQQRIQDVALRVTGGPVQILFAEPQIDAAFRQEQNESKLLLICGALAILLASFGLYGLAAFALKRQVKEVGVRKVMGASVGTILGLYLLRFSRPIIIANLLAWPVAIYFILQWIQRFPYQMERAWLAPLCVGTLAVVLSIAMLTVSVITMRAANTNPVRSLRYE